MSNIGNKLRNAFKSVRDTVVQEDNPNSPHLVFQRMNQNMLGESGETHQPTAPQVTEKDKKRKMIFSQESFEKAVWGDEE